jgi:hypothetical protein
MTGLPAHCSRQWQMSQRYRQWLFAAASPRPVCRWGWRSWGPRGAMQRCCGSDTTSNRPRGRERVDRCFEQASQPFSLSMDKDAMRRFLLHNELPTGPRSHRLVFASGPLPLAAPGTPKIPQVSHSFHKAATGELSVGDARVALGSTHGSSICIKPNVWHPMSPLGVKFCRLLLRIKIPSDHNRNNSDMSVVIYPWWRDTGNAAKA